MPWWNAVVGQVARPFFWARSIKHRLDEEQRTFEAGIEFVSEELVRNRYVAQRAKSGHTPTEVRELSTVEWDRWKGKILRLRDEDPLLWEELTAAFNDTIQARATGGHPPRPEHLWDLIERLRPFK